MNKTTVAIGFGDFESKRDFVELLIRLWSYHFVDGVSFTPIFLQPYRKLFSQQCFHATKIQVVMPYASSPRYFESKFPVKYASND